jgi:mRNA interferase RelE/StbE
VIYTVVVTKSAQKQLLGFPVEVRKRISERIEALAAVPRPADVKKLRGRDAWRIRVGDYRVIYEIHDKILRVIVINVGHRGEIYR